MKLTMFAILSLSLSLSLGACGEEGGGSATSVPESEGADQRFNISVGASGYSPSEVQVRAGEPVTMIFTRTTDEGCGEELAIPSQDIRRDLPLNEPVFVTFTPTEPGELRFTCGMDMYDGTIVVQ